MSDWQTEIGAMRDCYDALNPLERGEQLRILRWLHSRLKWENDGGGKAGPSDSLEDDEIREKEFIDHT